MPYPKMFAIRAGDILVTYAGFILISINEFDGAFASSIPDLSDVHTVPAQVRPANDMRQASPDPSILQVHQASSSLRLWDGCVRCLGTLSALFADINLPPGSGQKTSTKLAARQL